VYKKHYPPALKDEVWRLEKIGKDGAFHKKLNTNGINTVEDFLRHLIRDQQGLRSVSSFNQSVNFFLDTGLIRSYSTTVSSSFYQLYLLNTIFQLFLCPNLFLQMIFIISLRPTENWNCKLRMLFFPF
jgi:Calmodulin binding protein-like